MAVYEKMYREESGEKNYGYIRLKGDGLTAIPLEPKNMDYRKILNEVAAGTSSIEEKKIED